MEVKEEGLREGFLEEVCLWDFKGEVECSYKMEEFRGILVREKPQEAKQIDETVE